jgi:uncharacterized protein YaaQ
MKMIISIFKDSDADAVTQALTSAGFRMTRVASTGGFLKRGATTFLVGVEDDKVEVAIALMKEKTTASPGEQRATIFVVPVERFEQI